MYYSTVPLLAAICVRSKRLALPPLDRWEKVSYKLRKANHQISFGTRMSCLYAYLYSIKYHMLYIAILV